MNTKRKRYSSGNWWLPIRRFEFATHQTLDDTIHSINNLKETLMPGHANTIKLNRTDKQNLHTFSIYTHVGKNASVKIEGEIVTDTDGDVTLRGKAIVGNLFVLMLFFFTHFLLMTLIFLFMFIQTKLPQVLFMLIFPGAYLVMYGVMLHQREKQFNAFLTAVQAEKVKNDEQKVA